MPTSAPASPTSSWPYRIVADTNVFVSAVLPSARAKDKANGFSKPMGVEFLERAFYDQFVLLMSVATFYELIEKLQELEVPEALILELAGRLRDQAEDVQPQSFDRYCTDVDDDKFIHVAQSGRATHIVSHDRAIINGLLGRLISFKVVVILTFLRELRGELKRQRLAS